MNGNVALVVRALAGMVAVSTVPLLKVVVIGEPFR